VGLLVVMSNCAGLRKMKKSLWGPCSRSTLARLDAAIEKKLLYRLRQARRHESPWLSPTSASLLAIHMLECQANGGCLAPVAQYWWYSLAQTQ